MHFKHKHMDCNHIKFGGHHASKFGIIYSNHGHIGFNKTHTSLISKRQSLEHFYKLMQGLENGFT